MSHRSIKFPTCFTAFSPLIFSNFCGCSVFVQVRAGLGCVASPAQLRGLGFEEK